MMDKEPSRSVQRRIAAQKGLPAPDFYYLRGDDIDRVFDNVKSEIFRAGMKKVIEWVSFEYPEWAARTKKWQTQLKKWGL